MKKILSVFVCLLAFSGWQEMYGQQTQSATAGKETTYSNFKERLAFKTNLVNWVGLMPNIGLEMDVSNSVYNKWVVGVQATWNGLANEVPTLRRQLEVNDYRAEVKRYVKPSMTVRPGRKRTPKFWRTYYYGVYGGYTRFNLMWDRGMTGEMWHAGLTGGWQVPVYRCKNGGGLDLDLGASLGFVCLKYNRFKYENDQLMMTEEHRQKWLPYPVPTELRIGLVYRFKSVKDKYNKTKPKH